MGQISTKLRRGPSGFFHYCEPCDQLHPLPDGWTFNGNTSAPTFSPSFRQIFRAGRCCHYILTDGVLNYCEDSNHALAGKSVPLPDLPADYQDFCDDVPIPDLPERP